MPRLHEIEQHLHSMQDIREIMKSMKNLSLMETRKLARFLSSQQRVVHSIEQAAADFLAAYPHFKTPESTDSEVFLLIGAEQGFCGDFNQMLIEKFFSLNPDKSPTDVKLITIGTKLFNSLQNHPQLTKALSGPSVGQEVDAVLTELIQTLSNLQNAIDRLSITALHHEHGNDAIQITSLLPPFRNLKPPTIRQAYPPHLQLPAEHFYTDLIDHYLFAALYEMFYTSLMAEHYRRVQHLEGAIDRLDQRTDELGKKRNMLRQEEITEEIEVIMLSAGIVK